MNKYHFKKLTLFLLIISIGILGSCKDEEDVAPDLDNQEAPSPNIRINNWIKDVMDQVYYWLEDMKVPIANTSNPEEYFESFLFRPTDRFSAIYPNYQELINSLSGVSTEAGYELSLLRESNDNENVVGLITYVKKNSPAKNEGLIRGDLLTQINGVTMNMNNFQSVLRGRSAPHEVTIRRYDESTQSYGAPQVFNMNTVEIEESPNFLDTVFTIDSHKIGYVVYHFFAPGVSSQPLAYDNEMDEIFAKFKAEGINELIVDFRYNGGGFVSSAVNLASLIGPNINSEKVFSKTKYNSFLSNFDDFKNVQTKFRDKSQNIGNQLKSGTVYILTSTRTASASELIINGLKPYMNVAIIGGKTTGKNVGSAALQDRENINNNYGLLPIISKSFNSLDRSDYGNGFEPDLSVREIDFLPFRQFGDTRDPLLSAAINMITGQTSTGGRLQFTERRFVGSTLDAKIRQGHMIEEANIHEAIHENLRIKSN